MDWKLFIYEKFGFAKRKSIALQKAILDYYASDQKDCAQEVQYIRNHPVEKRIDKTMVFNHSFIEKYDSLDTQVYFDKTFAMYYVIHKGFKMYMKRSFSKKQIKDYYKSLLLEQDKNSPHHYLDPEMENKHYRTVVDVGAAEGIFALDIMEKADHIIMYEYDDAWLAALKLTFRDYADKVEIRKAFVSNVSDGMQITLDDDLEGSTDIDLLKMDVEGAEQKVLSGAKVILEKNSQVTALVCVYHNLNDEQEIKEKLCGYTFEVRAGKMLFPNRYSYRRINGKIVSPAKQMKGPFFTNGVMKITRSVCS